VGSETTDYLHRQLIKLGDMMGDGEHLEPGGKWIEQEYKRTMKALGIGPPRRNNTKVIDEHMEKRVAEVKCPACSDTLRQVRSGSMIASCHGCDVRYRLMSLRKAKRHK